MCRGDIGEAHADSVLRAQDDHRASFDRLSWGQLEVITTQHVAQDHEDLQHRVVATDASSRPGPERKIDERLAQFLIYFEETIRIKIFGVVPVATCMVCA